jgi:hypothetical protein
MTSIDMLPDDVLLEIFDFYVNEDLDDSEFFKKPMEEWQTLVHVCQRWRRLVFGSPRRLKLRLVCSPKTPARDTLDVWPPLPIFVGSNDVDNDEAEEGTDDISAVLERRDRVVKIELFNINDSDLEKILVVMQVPFPELTGLLLYSNSGTVSALSNSFLGGSAPRLEFFSLQGIPFLGLPKLLLSATHLVKLYLHSIPHSGYISPEAMVMVLSTSTSLKNLFLEFESPQSYPDQASRRPPPLTRSVLPALTSFYFKGVCEYLEDFVTRIDTPELDMLHITFFNQIVFDTPQFIQFINRTTMLGISENLKARVVFEDGAASIKLSSQTRSQTYGKGKLSVKIPCIELDWQVSSMEQVCTSCLPPLSTLEDLYVYELPNSQPIWQDNIENALWLELLHPFTTVKNLYLSKKFALRIMPALQELVRGRTTEVLPTLQNIFLEEPQTSETIQAAIQQFVATRQATGHPIAVSRWDSLNQDRRNY